MEKMRCIVWLRRLISSRELMNQLCDVINDLSSGSLEETKYGALYKNFYLSMIEFFSENGANPELIKSFGNIILDISQTGYATLFYKEDKVFKKRKISTPLELYTCLFDSTNWKYNEP